jgi:hypothetical protein
MKHRTAVTLACIVALVVVATVAAKVKIQTHRDKAFDFKTVRTYAWHPSGAGEVKILQATDEDPGKLQAQLDPVIRQAVEGGLAERGLTPAAGDDADLYVNYYLLIGASTSTQYLGQFVGSAPEWGLPPIMGSTTSLKIYEQGSLILDVVGRAQKSVIWRGIAQAEIDRLRKEAERLERVRGAVRDMLQKFPKVK